jgi:probable rRNA maturation factor
MNFHVDVQTVSLSPDIPTVESIQHWVDAALNTQMPTAELCIRIVDEAESQQLNRDYRHQDKPTNVLSFPMSMPGADIPYIGDIIMCAPIIVREASEQQKSLPAHWAHMVIHGILHLRGYDHLNDADATLMESLEIEILHQLGFTNPYLHPLDEESHEA